MQLTTTDSGIANADNRIIWLYQHWSRPALDANIAGSMEDNGVHFHISKKKNKIKIKIKNQ